MKKIRVFSIAFLVVLLVMGGLLSVQAHSGRTDSAGGHRDNKNVSGLGYYHYHCGGYPAHLHSGGVCPYSYSYEEPKPVVKPTPKLNKKLAALKSGKSVTLKLANASGTVNWKSSNKKVATVDAHGKVTAEKAGTCTISAVYEGKTYSCKITVTNPFRLYTTSLILRVGQKAYIDTNIKAASIEWRTNKPEIAVVTKRGKVRAKAVGRCTIFAKYKGKTLKCKVVVKK